MAKTLAKAYKEIGRWNDAKCKPVERLRQYLQEKGVTEDQFLRSAAGERFPRAIIVWLPDPLRFNNNLRLLNYRRAIGRDRLFGGLYSRMAEHREP